MARVLWFLVFVVFANLCNLCSSAGNSEKYVFYNYTYEYGIEYTIQINRTEEYVFEYIGTEFFESEYPARISVSSYLANRTYPIFITARQQKGVLSWQLPLVVGEQEHLSISRTLCPNKNFFLQPAKSNTTKTKDVSIQNHPIIHVSTSSSANLKLFLRVDMVKDFYLGLNSEKNVTTGPSQPLIYFYSFEYGAMDGTLDLDNIGTWYKNRDSKGNLLANPEKSGNLQEGTVSNYSSTVWDLGRTVLKSSIFTGIKESLKTVLIRLDSDDDTCMLVSIQNASCPVFDTERDIAYEGFYATVSRRGGITVTQKRFPLGFYIVLLVRATDQDCSGFSNSTSMERFFSWNPSHSVRHSSTTTRIWRGRAKTLRLRIIPSITYQQYWVAIVVALAAIFIIYLLFLIGLTCHKSRPRNMEVVEREEHNAENNGVSTSRDSPTTACSALDIATNNYGIRRNSYASLADGHEPPHDVFLSELCKKDTLALGRRSSMFLWNLLTVAVFYGLPVVQLVITYQRVVNQTGNQDQCYYNFLCAHPLGFLSDFNHVYSNLGYVMLGALFIIFVWRKHKLHCDPTFDKFYGIPQHHGLYYAMGVALMMEGVLSGSYHVCPNNTNFQFDTSFMYVMAVLCMVKIYQSRHPDINARAHGTFGVLAGAVFIGLIGVLYPNIYFWVVFTIIHIMTCLVLTLQIYYLGRFKMDWSCCSKCMCGGLCRPAYRGRCILMLLANLANWALAGFGLWAHSKDFATHLLYIFLMNLALHLFWYLTMKLVHRERILWPAWVLLLLALATWGGALRFFFDNSISWELTPAQSRTFNKQCGLLQFYDTHDIWHFLSAGAMFFSFMLLLVIDDDITHQPRSKIPVF